MPNTLELGRHTIDLQTGRVDEGLHRLTHRELLLVTILAERQGAAVPREELMRAFGYHPNAQSRAVDKAMHSLRQKMEVTPSAPHHLLTVAGGYRLTREVRTAGSPPPVPRDRFVGRREDLEKLERNLHEAALVCVTGPAGVGKTRLVLHYLCERGPNDGVWFCDLTQARTEAEAVSTVARTLGVPANAAQVGLAIAARGRCLLVLDNLEQVAGPARQVLDQWTRGAPEATFLLTSRQVLGLAGERVQALDVLSPEDGRALFVVRAEAVRDGFRAAYGDDAAIPDLVTRLDSLPLAIELAAARSRVLPPQELLSRLSEGFRLLGLVSTGPPLHGRERHLTLRAALDWSWNLLEPWAAAALAQLTVFEGGFDLAGVEAVLDLGAYRDAPWVPDVLQVLVDRSLVAQHGEHRFRLLVTIKEYASERLEVDATALKRHGAFA